MKLFWKLYPAAVVVLGLALSALWTTALAVGLYEIAGWFWW